MEMEMGWILLLENGLVELWKSRKIQKEKTNDKNLT